MQRVCVKIFIPIIFGLFLLLFFSVIDENFRAKSGHADTNKNSYRKKVVQIFETKEPAYQTASIERIERQIDSFFSYK